MTLTGRQRWHAGRHGGPTGCRQQWMLVLAEQQDVAAAECRGSGVVTGCGSCAGAAHQSVPEVAALLRETSAPDVAPMS